MLGPCSSWSPRRLCKQSSWSTFFQTYKKALGLACACAALSATLKYFHEYRDAKWIELNANSDSAYASFTLFLSLMFAFRTGQAYNRFWEGVGLVHGMIGDWYDAASSIVAFCDHSKLDRLTIRTFQHLIVRLFSLQTALILSELEGSEDGEGTAMTYSLVDIQGIDAHTLRALVRGDNKPEMVFQKIQRLIVHHMRTGVLSVPAPILTRVFQEMGSGMLNYHQAIKLLHVKFPWPYRVLTEILLLVHLVLSPITMVRWTSTPFWAAILAGGQIFLMWSLAALNEELENPFKQNGNDLDCEYIQHEINIRLVRLLEVAEEPLPELASSAKVHPGEMLLDQAHAQPQRIPVGERKAQVQMRKRVGATQAAVESLKGLASTLDWRREPTWKDPMSPASDTHSTSPTAKTLSPTAKTLPISTYHPGLRAQYGSPSSPISTFAHFRAGRERSPRIAGTPEVCTPFDRHGSPLSPFKGLKAAGSPVLHAVIPVAEMSNIDTESEVHAKMDEQRELHCNAEGHVRLSRSSPDCDQLASRLPEGVTSAPSPLRHSRVPSSI